MGCLQHLSVPKPLHLPRQAQTGQSCCYSVVNLPTMPIVEPGLSWSEPGFMGGALGGMAKVALGH